MAINARGIKRNGVVDIKKYIKTMNDNNYLKKKVMELQEILAGCKGELKQYQEGYKNLAKDHNRLQQEIVGAQGMLWCLAHKNGGEIFITDAEMKYATLQSESESRKLKSSRDENKKAIVFAASIEKKIDLSILKKKE